MTDIILNHMTNGQNVSVANTNFDNIQDNINNHSLQKDGGNNVLFQDLDLNSNDLLNVANITAGSIKLGGIILVPGNIQAVNSSILAPLLSSPTPIGDVTPNSGAFTNLTSNTGSVNVSLGVTTPNPAHVTTLGSTDTTQSTSSTTGAITTAGGLGIAKDIYCGGTYHGGAILGSGSIDAVPIGSTTAATGKFTNLTASGLLTGFPGRLLNVQVFTASGTYTPTVGTSKIIVEVQGPGGGGGGTAATGASQSASAGGGGAGAYAKVYMTVPSAQTLTIPAGGLGGAAGNNAGAAASNTTFGSLITCPGGSAGSGSPVFASAAFTVGVAPTSAAPTVTTGTTLFSAIGGCGGQGLVINPGLAQTSGAGGSSVFGPGGAQRGSNQPGQAASNFGGGGSGGNAAASQAAQAGGNGASGIILVYEFS